MSDRMNRLIESAVTELRRIRWAVVAAISLVIGALATWHSQQSPTVFPATLLMQLEFVLHDGTVLKVREFGTNSLNRSIIRSEVRVLCSDLLLRTARERLRTASKGDPLVEGQPLGVMRFAGDALPDWRFLGNDLQLHASGLNPELTANMLNAIAEAYGERRADLCPAPPGCKTVRASLLEPARPAQRALARGPSVRTLVGATLLGLAAGTAVRRERPQVQQRFAWTFICWFWLILGFVSLLSPYKWAVGLAGAILLAYFFAAGAHCINLLTRHEPSISPRLMRYTFVFTCLILIGGGLLYGATARRNYLSTARVRVGIEQPSRMEELAVSYDPSFLETECAVITSRSIVGAMAQQSSVADRLRRNLDKDMPASALEALLKNRIHAEPVKGSNLIDLFFWSDRRNESRTTPAAEIANLYREYWEGRSRTNSANWIRVTLINNVENRELDRQSAFGNQGGMVLASSITSLLILSGVLWVAWCSHRPAWLSLVPCVLVIYLSILGFAWSTNPEMASGFHAASRVRFWPIEDGLEGKIRTSPEQDVPERLVSELKLARSEAVIQRAAQTLEARNATQHDLRAKLRRNPTEKSEWLTERLTVEIVPKAKLLKFVAQSEDPDEALSMAKAAAQSYCEAYAKSREGEAGSRPWAEVLEDVVFRGRGQEHSGVVRAMLFAGLAPIGLFTIGTVVGFVGLCIEKIRRANVISVEKPKLAQPRPRIEKW